MSLETSKRDVRVGRRRGGVALVALVVAAVFVLAACGSGGASSDSKTTTTAKGATTTDPKAPGTKGTAPTSLDGAFVSTDVTGYRLAPDSELTFTFKDEILSVNAGCNTINSGYTLKGGTLKWTGVPLSTQMACDTALANQDAWITGLITDGVQVAASDDGATLTLTSGDVTITLDAVAPDPISGTTWTLDGTIANEAVASLPVGVEPPTLTIDEDARVTLFAGCNRGGGNVVVAETTLTFSPMGLTKMACTGDAVTLEAQVIKVLEGETTYTVKGDTLTIEKGDEGLVYKAS